MATFSEDFFHDLFDFEQIERTVTSTVRLAIKDPVALYLFFQRYSHFNGYASAMISRLASTIGLSRYTFSNPELIVKEEADRGMDIAAQVMSAAADEGANGTPVHRALAQLTVKTVGDYAELTDQERNTFAKIPSWLQEIVRDVISNYEGKINDEAALIKAMGFHMASEMLGDREYALLDMVVRYENKGIGFDRYLKQEAKPVLINDHRYTPWSWVLIHSRHDGSGVEVEHSEFAISALNMAVRYGSASEKQMKIWAQAGFRAFVELQQRLLREIRRECLELAQEKAISSIPPSRSTKARKTKKIDSLSF
ncbi:hypothetical protein [Pleurocapsa sp. PCC 7319]|uniref:hypothetical protein n=1 Tax=Pleurocapsa sp. PCC 7319 TaxID=118161 RepID=UPI000349F33A|nr:hypothetical protein [Pleurocapsa sp. PCC 7319]